jgi:hypothetical protein
MVTELKIYEPCMLREAAFLQKYNSDTLSAKSEANDPIGFFRAYSHKSYIEIEGYLYGIDTNIFHVNFWLVEDQDTTKKDFGKYRPPEPTIDCWINSFRERLKFYLGKIKNGDKVKVQGKLGWLIDVDGITKIS